MDNILKERENEILCPNCIDPINNKPTNNNENMNIENEINEFEKFTCQKCTLDFSFIFCIFCEKKIYMKIFPKSEKYNGLNGYNIKCPYESCQKIFYFTSCPKCEKIQKIQKYIKEGNIITCIYCNIKYIQVHSPVKYSTDMSYTEISKFTTNFPNGVFITKDEKGFQKINCYYCLRPIIFPILKDHNYFYYECQKVECPYEDCKKEFNRIICPSCCSENYINDGYYQMGSLITCNFCKESFGKIICHFCKQMNTCKKQFKLGHMKCGFGNCLKESNLVNCIFCRKLNFFDLNENVNGKTIKCGYCKNIFNEVLCPFCRQINPFPLGDFSFGKAYKCQYITCMKIFQFSICPKCFCYTILEEISEGQKMKCDKCKIIFRNIGCPFCKINIIIVNSSFKIGKMIKCPNANCQKIFSFINCSNCQKLIFSQENENLCGKAVKCPYKGCKIYTVNIICPICNVNIIYANEKKSFIEGEKIICKNCKNKFKFTSLNEEVFSNDIIYLKEIEGKTINFGVGEVDENYMVIQQLFTDFSKIKKQKQIILPSFCNFDRNLINNINLNYIKSNYEGYQDCMICQNNIKESIFYPCGHRCVCYNCAVLVFIVKKKCPKCDKNIICIIRKIFE